MPRPAQPGSLCAPTVNAWPPSTCAMVMMTVETAAMSSNVPPLWPAGPTISAVTLLSVYRSCGAVTETPTAPTVRMKGQSAAAVTGSRTCLTAEPTALQANFAVPMGNVFGWPGSVTEIRTARTNLMSQTVVSSPSLSVFCISLPVSPPYTVLISIFFLSSKSPLHVLLFKTSLSAIKCCASWKALCTLERLSWMCPCDRDVWIGVHNSHNEKVKANSHFVLSVRSSRCVHTQFFVQLFSTGNT